MGLVSERDRRPPVGLSPRVEFLNSTPEEESRRANRISSTAQLRRPLTSFGNKADTIRALDARKSCRQNRSTTRKHRSVLRRHIFPLVTSPKTGHMNCVVYSSRPDANRHDRADDERLLKERRASRSASSPPPSEPASPPGVGLRGTRETTPVPCASPPPPPPSPSLATHARPPLPTYRIGKYVLLDQSEGSPLCKSIDLLTQEEYVCKIIKNKEANQHFAAHFRLDSHEHINEIQEVVVGETKTYVFFPPSYGDLYTHMRTQRRLREADAKPLFAQIVSAVEHCHENGVVLRDLKLRKFVFKDAERTQLKLETLEDAVVLDDDDDSLSDKHGCPAYVSPEILNASDQYSGCAADAWSLGVMLYTMLVGRYPFHDTEPSLLFAKIRRSNLSVPDWLSSRAKCLIRGLLRPSPQERLTAADALKHPWLSSALPELPCKVEPKSADQTVPTGAIALAPQRSDVRRFK